MFKWKKYPAFIRFMPIEEFVKNVAENTEFHSSGYVWMATLNEPEPYEKSRNFYFYDFEEKHGKRPSIWTRGHRYWPNLQDNESFSVGIEDVLLLDQKTRKFLKDNLAAEDYKSLTFVKIIKPRGA